MMKLVDVIPVGKENAIHQVDLAKQLGVTPSTVKIMIQNARHQGRPDIMSGSNGYWLTEDKAELKEYVLMTLKQANTRLETIKPLMYILDEIEGQMSISELQE